MVSNMDRKEGFNDPLLIGSHQTRMREHTLDDLLVQLTKRLYSVWPLFAMVFTTINQVFEIARNETAQSKSAGDYDSYVFVTSGNFMAGYTCEYGVATSAIVYCPYDTVPAFQAVISLWVVYFTIFVIYRLYATWTYSTDDLRFYIAIDKFNGHVFNRVMVILGVVFTFLSLGIGIYYLSAKTEWSEVVDTNTVMSMIVFLGINMIALRGFSKQFITSHSGTSSDPSDCTMDAFQKPILIHSKGMFSSVDSVIQPILVSYMLYLSRRDDDAILRQHGEPRELIDAMNKLYN